MAEGLVDDAIIVAALVVSELVVLSGAILVASFVPPWPLITDDTVVVVVSVVEVGPVEIRFSSILTVVVGTVVVVSVTGVTVNTSILVV